MKVKPLIVVTNDDGILSPGIKTLARALLQVGDVIIVAPETNQSAKGRSYYMGEDQGSIVEDRLVFEEGTIRTFAVTGTPAQCVLYAHYEIAKYIIGRKIDIVCSGINIGENIGTDLTLSGTVGACIEAHILGIKAVAFSLEYPFRVTGFKWSTLDKYLVQFVREELNHNDNSYRFLNVNFPNTIDDHTEVVNARVGVGSPFILKQKDQRDISQADKPIIEMRVKEEYLIPETDYFVLKKERKISVSRIKYLVE
ncbi:MAG: 5'/3'-nucleotidase SurE [Erysipelotrichaceae bacterium]|jgi:5'-nucleotidase|nr:5'/3'-nucleotidase SurE [Erysipelotrichaceae bacterium]